MDAKCRAPKDLSWPGLKALFDGVERCGKPVTKVTSFGPYCEACVKKIKEDAANGRNLLGLLGGTRMRR